MRVRVERLSAHHPSLVEVAGQDLCPARIRIRGGRNLCYARWLQDPGWTVDSPGGGDMATARVSPPAGFAQV